MAHPWITLNAEKTQRDMENAGQGLDIDNITREITDFNEENAAAAAKPKKKGKKGKRKGKRKSKKRGPPPPVAPKVRARCQTRRVRRRKRRLI